MARSLYPKRQRVSSIPLHPVWIVAVNAPFNPAAASACGLSTSLEFRAAAELAYRSAPWELDPFILSPAEGAVSYREPAEIPDRSFTDLDDRALDAVCTLAVSDIGNAAHLRRRPRVAVLASRRISEAIQRAIDGRIGAGKISVEMPLADLDPEAALRWLAGQLEGTLAGCPDELTHLLTD